MSRFKMARERTVVIPWHALFLFLFLSSWLLVSISIQYSHIHRQWQPPHAYTHKSIKDTHTWTPFTHACGAWGDWLKPGLLARGQSPSFSLDGLASPPLSTPTVCCTGVLPPKGMLHRKATTSPRWRTAGCGPSPPRGERGTPSRNPTVPPLPSYQRMTLDRQKRLRYEQKRLYDVPCWACT